MQYKKYDIFLITGGTGGHVFPAISFSEYLTSKGISNLIVTDIRGLNYFDKNKYKTKVISSSHLNKSKFEIIKALIKLFIGFVQFNILLFYNRPKNIITFGSYTSFIPIVCTLIFKKFFKTKIYFHEQNSIIGKVHKFFLGFSDNIFLTFKNTKGISLKYNVVYSGFPERKEIIKYKKINYIIDEKTKKLNLFVFGGSQGALNLSRIIVELLTKLSYSHQKLINLTIQVPKNDIGNLKSKLDKTKVTYEIRAFYKDIIKRLSSTDICICRAGSSTINEILSLKVPSIMIPLPTASNNHQYYNAKFLSDYKATILIEEKDLLNEKSLKIIKGIISNRNLLKSMFNNLNKIVEIKSNDLIYKKIFCE